MKKIFVNNILHTIVKFCFVVAFIASGSASFWGAYQVKEPENIKRKSYLRLIN